MAGRIDSVVCNAGGTARNPVERRAILASNRANLLVAQKCALIAATFVNGTLKALNSPPLLPFKLYGGNGLLASPGGSAMEL